MLVFNSRRLVIDSQTLHQCGVTQDNCDFTAAQINDEVEDSVASFQKQTSLSEAAISTQLATYGLPAPQRLHQPKTEQTVGKHVQRWTFELIKVACCEGLMDFRTYGRLVEEGIVGEDQARTTVRHAVRGLERAEKLLDVVDKRYVVEAEQAAEQATSTLIYFCIPNHHPNDAAPACLF